MNPLTADPATAAISQRRYARRALLAAVLGYAMDGFDLLILGFMLPAIALDFHLSPAQGGALVSWTLVGAVLGGIGFGILSDRYGRVRVLSWTILLFAVCTGLCAVARGYAELLVYRTLAGIGLGGEFGIGMALVAEAWPAAYRARAALLTPLLLPLIGWRGMFAVGLLPAVAAYGFRRRLAEPALFVRQVRETLDDAASGKALSAPRLLLADWPTARASLGIVTLCSVQNFGYYGLMIWMPSYLSQRFGYSLTRSGLWTAATVAGMALGIGVFGWAADRFGRKPAFILYQVGAAAMVLIYAHLTTPLALLLGGAVMGWFVNGMLGGYGALISELYPTRARATAQNVLFNLGRAVGAFGPLTVGVLAARYGFSTAIAVLAGIYVLDVLATLWLIPERRGAALE